MHGTSRIELSVPGGDGPHRLSFPSNAKVDEVITSLSFWLREFEQAKEKAEEEAEASETETDDIGA